jgi:hypothetical protein
MNERDLEEPCDCDVESVEAERDALADSLSEIKEAIDWIEGYIADIKKELP